MMRLQLLKTPMGEDMETLAIIDSTVDLGNNIGDSPKEVLTSITAENIVNVPCMESTCYA